MSTELSYYQQEALKFLVAQQNKKESEASEADIELAKKFTNYGQSQALEVLGVEKADLALTYNSVQTEALKSIYKGIPLTDDEIKLTQQFTEYYAVIALKILGVEKADLALELKDSAANALRIICQNHDGSFKTASQEDIDLAKTFTNYGQSQALEVLGVEKADLAKTFKGAQGYALQAICNDQRVPSEKDIETARKFTHYGQVDALRHTNNTDVALTFDENTGSALQTLLLKTGNYSTMASEADIELAQQFKLDTQVSAINILQNATDALKVITTRQLVKLKEFGPSELDKALEEGKKEVEAINYDEQLAELKKLMVEQLSKSLQPLCAHKELLSTLESCLQNLNTLDDDNDNEEIPELTKAAENLSDLYILTNQESLLTATGSFDEIVNCVILTQTIDLCHQLPTQIVAETPDTNEEL